MNLIIDVNTEETTISLFKNFDSTSRLKFRSYPTLFNYSAAFEKMKKIIEQLVKEYGSIEYTGVVITGIVDYERNILQDSAYLHDYEKVNVCKDIKQITLSKVFMVQDSVASALAERNNLAKGLTEYAHVTVEYGVGGTYIKQSKNGGILVFPTELGHTIIVPGGRRCPCGQRGCVEAYIGGESLKQRFLVKPSQIKDKSVWEEAVDILSIASTNLLVCYPAKNIIYTGRSIQTMPIMKQRIRGMLQEYLSEEPNQIVHISTLEKNANTFGGLEFLKLTIENKVNIIT